MKHTIIGAVAAILLAGCSVTAPVDPLKAQADAGSVPADYKTIILSDVKTAYFDPYSIRSAQISQPFLQNHATLGHFWAVCVQANGENRMGGYVGIQTDAYVFRHGALLQKSSHPMDYCATATYQPFPEMEAIS